ncbi:MAG: carbon-nitrogen hydrolase family protein [Fluviibacter sp.]
MMNTTPETVRVASVQMVSSTCVADNVAAVRRLVAGAAAEGAQLVVLPEFFPMIGANDDARLAIREMPGRGPLQSTLAELATTHGIWLVGGSIPLAGTDVYRALNSTLVFDPQGQQISRYDKMHLFGFKAGAESYDESLSIEPGGEPVAFDTPFARIGLSICYDLRFPEYFRQLGEVDILILPAAFTATTGEAHWEVLLRARAIENQCYVIASAQGGRHETGRKTWGHSMIIDPWGDILSVLPSGEGWVCADFNRQRLETIRHRLPALKHRRIRP